MATQGINPNKDRGPMVLAVTTVLVFLATVFALARFYARTWTRKHIYLDDLLVVVSVVLLWCSLACISVAVSNGLGRHYKTLTVHQQEKVVFWYLQAVSPVILALGIPKLAVATILNRILDPGPKLKTTVWGLATSSAVALLSVIFLAFFRCAPVRSQWDFSITDKKCMDVSVKIWSARFTGAYSALVDLFFAVWPALIFCSTQMSRIKTIRLSLAMGFGAIASGIAAYKCISFSGVTDPDFSWGNNETVISIMQVGSDPRVRIELTQDSAEATALIIAASIPMLAPLFRSIHTSYKKLRHRIFGTPTSQAPQPPDRPDNNAWDFPTRNRVRPRDDAELGIWSLATSPTDGWDLRQLDSSHARADTKGTQSSRDHGSRSVYTQNTSMRSMRQENSA